MRSDAAISIASASKTIAIVDRLGTSIGAESAAPFVLAVTSVVPLSRPRTVALAVISGDLDRGAVVTVGQDGAARTGQVVGEPATAQDVRQAAPESLGPARKRFRS